MGTSGKTQTELNAQGLQIAIVVSRYNPDICQGLLQGALTELKKLGLANPEQHVTQVPGAFELPLAAQWYSQQGFDGVICLGTVIRGDTAHFDYVCQGVTQGLQQAILQSNTPMAFGVLTTDTLAQAQERSADNEHNKGLEAARTVVEMIQLRKKIQSSINP